MNSGSAINSVLLCGNGLAFEMTLAAMKVALPASLNIIAVETKPTENYDDFYGSLTAPNAYNFLVTLGLTEPKLFLKTDTGFTYGTKFHNWAGHHWVQSFHLPFPVWENIQFQHWLFKANAKLLPYNISAVCGLKGVFAHPPQDPRSPLSRAEYGYQFHADEWSALLRQDNQATNITRKTSDIKSVNSQDDKIMSLELANGERIEADLFIDASGPDRCLHRVLSVKRTTCRELEYRSDVTSRQKKGSALRDVVLTETGWRSETFLRGKSLIMDVSAPGSLTREDVKSINLTRTGQPWVGNCIAIGQAAGEIEPLSPAPMMMLQRDIERLNLLFPISTEMSVEAREYNRLYKDDIVHTDIFGEALFATCGAPDNAYWTNAQSTEMSDKLSRKITQFKSRGFLVNYDLEPFNEQDWMILHFGMGRRAERLDPFLSHIPNSAVFDRLGPVKMSFENMAQKMPPYDNYLTNFRRYLEKNYGG